MKKIIKTANTKHSRREFLKYSITAAATMAFPITLLSSCDNNDPSEDNSPFISFEITFSKPMNTTSVENALTISPVPAQGPSTLEWSENDTILYCKYPVAGAGTAYSVTVGALSSDTAGNTLDVNGDGSGSGLSEDDYGFGLSSV